MEAKDAGAADRGEGGMTADRRDREDDAEGTCPDCGGPLKDDPDGDLEEEPEAEVCVLCGERFGNESEVATQSLFSDGTTAWWSALTRDHDAAAAGSLELVGPVCFVCATVPAMAAARATAWAADLRELAAKVEDLAERVAAGK